MNILFFGTPDFAVPSLRALANDKRFKIAGVITQPDKPVGRNAVLTPPPVKTAALELGFSVRQPERLTDPEFRSWIESVGPSCDAFVVIAYGKIFREWFLKLPKNGLVVNVHASLLPRWRGASPITAAIAAGDKKTGVSIMRIIEALDAGPVYRAIETPIASDETGDSLHDRLSELGASALADTLAEIIENKIEPVPQDDSNATFCKTLTREDGRIDWTKSAEEIERLVRAYDPWPGTWTTLEGKRLKILKGSAGERGHGREKQEGQALICDGDPCVVAGNGTLLKLERVQIEGRGAVNGKEFLNGFRDWEGKQLE